MTEISAEEHYKNVEAIKSMKKHGWILIAVALVLTVLAIVALVVGMDYVPQIYSDWHENGETYKVFEGFVYKGLTDIFGCVIAAVVANFFLFVILQKGIWFNSNKVSVPLVCKIIKAILHIIATLLIVIMSIVTAAIYISSYAYKTADPWILGLYGMCSIGEVIMLLVYYWNERFARGPAGADLDYLFGHSKLFNRSEKAYGFIKFYIAVPYVSYLLGYLISVALGFLAPKFGNFVCGGVHLIIMAAAVGLSVYFFFKKYRVSKYEVRGYHARTGSPKDKSDSSGSLDYSEKDEPKPVDKGYAEGKKRLSNELYEHNGLKFVPYSHEWPTYVSNVRLSVQLSNKDYFGISGKLVLHGNVTCSIKREESYPKDAAQKVLDEIIDNIISHAREILDELSDKYSNYNKSFAIDCSGIKISYKII